jgi:hypothetical protein
MLLQDDSRLVDVCRQSIVFRNGKDLASCLYKIIGDPDVKVVRVKNRLDPQYNSAASAGYRDTGLNLVVRTEETCRLGVDRHVCEVQLLLLPFAEIKVHSCKL